MLSTGGVNNASGGIWQTSRANPTPAARCGIRVALILDLSGSVGGSIGNLHTAATTFVNSLVGTASSVGLFTFATNGPANATNNQNRPLTSVSTAGGGATVDGWINGTTVQPNDNSQFTNWDRALNQVTESPVTYDIAVVVTDGDPTAYGVPATVQTDGRTRFRETENGIFSANGLKTKGTRIVAFGVGAGVGGSGQNLASISGPTLNSDFYQTTDYPTAGTQLRNLALGACQGTVSVIKQVLPPGSTTTAGAQPAPGWTFGATTSTSGVTIDPTSAVTNGTGGVNFNLTYPGGTDTASVTVNETQQSGFTLFQQGGLNATCTRLDTNRRGHRHQQRSHRVHGRRPRHRSHQLQRVQRGAEPGRHCPGQQAVDRERDAVRQRGAACRPLGDTDRQRHPGGVRRRGSRVQRRSGDPDQRDGDEHAAAVHRDRPEADTVQRDARGPCAAVHSHARRQCEHLHDHQHGHLYVEPPAHQDGGGRYRPPDGVDARCSRTGTAASCQARTACPARLGLLPT